MTALVAVVAIVPVHALLTRATAELPATCTGSLAIDEHPPTNDHGNTLVWGDEATGRGFGV
ncbi:MAG: hypothetical protein ABIR68_19680 [Ilumatobacteraceae bacterium]